MGKGKMDDAAAERIKKARGEKVSHNVVLRA